MISLVLFVPTVYWVHLKLPRLRPVIAFLALIPFVVPPIVLVVGLLNFYQGSPEWFYDKPWGFLVARRTSSSRSRTCSSRSTRASARSTCTR